ncbi:uroporphyrinogen-III synthase [Paenibacillus sp. PastF-3]|jgi:uroporphyrinogen-III synthase|uniref:uroporphyrinogen-III synthase n=1 Tax=Paenibacillus TaxID=44249 RepID=UPI000BA0CBC9|nr:MULTISPECIES: uroporphyrinogen-III synthase [unclassified Paenibacillus]MDH6371141.1 uroporphyrinogen-III synthase [Paenibacillus sp. PastF-3]OZQ86749.1 uroporphyrinogen-III synthase [Paenibacillus sp. VTT E-133291]
MAEQLKGFTVALAGPRKSEEMAKLVQNMGGTALCRPAQGTVFLDDEALEEGLNSWISDPPYLVILTTGMGLDALFQTAERLNIAERFLEVLSGSIIAARGYKTVNALKKRGLTPEVRDDDGSTIGLIRGLQSLDLQGKEVVLQLHGDPAPRMLEWLQEAGANTRQVLPYRHTLPEPGELERLLTEIIEGKIDAVAFTSAPQFRFLSQFAREQGKLEEMLKSFEDKVLAVSVGRITSEALKEEGVQRIIMPEHERMGSMIVELGKYVGANR